METEVLEPSKVTLNAYLDNEDELRHAEMLRDGNRSGSSCCCKKRVAKTKTWTEKSGGKKRHFKSTYYEYASASSSDVSNCYNNGYGAPLKDYEPDGWTG